MCVRARVPECFPAASLGAAMTVTRPANAAVSFLFDQTIYVDDSAAPQTIVQ